MKKTVCKVAVGICVLLLVISAGILFWKWWRESRAENRFRNLDFMRIEAETEEAVTKSEYDWEALKKENEHIYAWLYIPNTNVDYPVLQHPTDDSFYLNHNIDGSVGYPGCIYSEVTYNKTNMADSHTVFYGHNMKNGTMFKTLHKFEDKNFFDENRYIYVFTPKRTFVYEIFAAYTSSNDHLLAEYFYESEGQQQAYLEYVVSTAKSAGHLREDVQVTTEDRILTLSTCVANHAEKRYLVSGVLIDTDVSGLAK